jgi:hypothetical protein
MTVHIPLNISLRAEEKVPEMSVTSACVACNLVLRASWSSSVVTDMDASLALVKWNDRMEDERTTCCKNGMQRAFISEPSTLLFPIGIHLLLTQQCAKFRLRLGPFSFLESFGDWLITGHLFVRLLCRFATSPHQDWSSLPPSRPVRISLG